MEKSTVPVENAAAALRYIIGEKRETRFSSRYADLFEKTTKY
jgi:hypothetical protein